MLYAYDFRDDPQRHGWTWIPSGGSSTVFVESEGWYPDKGGKLVGPAIPANPDPFIFYRFCFRTRTSERGYWVVTTQDNTGVDQVDDTYSSVEPSLQWLDHDVVVRNRAGAATLRLSFQGHAPIVVSDLRVEVVDAAEAARCGDRLYATLPPLQWTPPAQRWNCIPRTRAKLGGGGELRVVQLGDSIVNDTNNGNWDALVVRAWPGARLRMITSVRGSTGCWHYRHDPHFAHYITRHLPELLLIGGISNQPPGVAAEVALADLRSVAIRARDQLGCEVVLLSGPLSHDWRAWDQTRLEAELERQRPPLVPEFTRGLQALAESDGFAYIDCHSAWHEYLGNSCRPWQWFHRDAVHGNNRGKQVVARILERWFNPGG